MFQPEIFFNAKCCICMWKKNMQADIYQGILQY